MNYSCTKNLALPYKALTFTKIFTSTSCCCKRPPFDENKQPRDAKKTSLFALYFFRFFLSVNRDDSLVFNTVTGCPGESTHFLIFQSKDILQFLLRLKMFLLLFYIKILRLTYIKHHMLKWNELIHQHKEIL